MATRTVPAKPYIGYVRRSQDNGSGVSEDAQRLAIEGWAAMSGHKIKFLAPDLDESGKSLDRPSMREARGMVNAGKAAGIVAAKLDRITRNVGDLMALLREAREGDWNLVACDLGLDLGTKNGKLVATQLGAVAEWFLDNITESLNEFRCRAVLAHGVHGGNKAPLGYRFTWRDEEKGLRGPLEIVPEEAALVRAAFEARADGKPWSELLGILGLASASSASRLIANDVYLGTASSGKTAKPDAHEAIIDPVTFRRANKQRSVRPAGYGKSGFEWLLGGGILRCATCGGTMTGDGSLRAYRCKNNSACTGKASIKKELVEPAVFDLAVGWHALKAPEFQALREADDSLLPALADALAEALAEREEISDAEGLSALRRAEALTEVDERVESIKAEMSQAEAGLGWLAVPVERAEERLAAASVTERREFVREMCQAFIFPVGRGQRVPVEDRLKIQFLDGGLTAGGVPAEQWPEPVGVEDVAARAVAEAVRFAEMAERLREADDAGSRKRSPLS